MPDESRSRMSEVHGPKEHYMSREPRRSLQSQRWTASAKHSGQAQRDALSDQVAVYKLIFHFLTLPIWAPFYVRRRLKRRREMATFATEFVRGQIRSDQQAKEIALEWIKNHPEEYVLGEYDPKLPKLQRTFNKILKRNT